jgi:hypothetical protein
VIDRRAWRTSGSGPITFLQNVAVVVGEVGGQVVVGEVLVGNQKFR